MLAVFNLTNIIICCGGFVASGPHFSVASNYAHALLDALTNNRHEQSTYHMIHNDTAAHPYGCVNDVLDRICRQMHAHKIGTQMAVRRYACAHAASNSPWIGRICRRTDRQSDCC